MTKLDLSTIKPIPGFDCVKMKREIQAKIYEETKHMTWEEQRERLRQVSERAKRRRAERANAQDSSQDRSPHSEN